MTNPLEEKKIALKELNTILTNLLKKDKDVDLEYHYMEKVIQLQTEYTVSRNALLKFINDFCQTYDLDIKHKESNKVIIFLKNNNPKDYDLKDDAVLTREDLLKND